MELPRTSAARIREEKRYGDSVEESKKKEENKINVKNFCTKKSRFFENVQTQSHVVYNERSHCDWVVKWEALFFMHFTSCLCNGEISWNSQKNFFDSFRLKNSRIVYIFGNLKLFNISNCCFSNWYRSNFRFLLVNSSSSSPRSFNIQIVNRHTHQHFSR